MRASTLVLGPLVARCGRARVSLPGGCAIGARPIDLHIKGLERLGAKITQDHGYVEASAERLKGAEIVFDKITVTGTEDLLMAATLAEGETVMQNCAREPEVADLADLLNKMGAQIEGAGTSTIRVKGVSKLHGAKHAIIPDRIEAATFIIAGALTGGDLNVTDCDPQHLGALLQKLHEAGVKTIATARFGAGDGRRSAQGRRCEHRRISRLPHRHAGAVHGAGHAGRGHVGDHGEYFRKPLHARAGNGAHGSQYQD